MAVPEGYVALGLVGFTDRGDYSEDGIYMQNDLVHRNNAIWKCNIDNTTGIEPAENDNWTIFVQSQTDLAGISATDTQGMVTGKGEVVVAQELLDAIADRVANKLLEKSKMSNVQVNDETMVPTSALVYAMQQAITNLNSNITDQTDLVVIEVTDFAASTATAINCPWQNYQFLIITFGMYNNITVSHMVPVVFFRTTAAAKRVLLYNPTNINAFCQCYQNGEGSIIIDLSSDMVALTNYRIHVYGVLAR